MSNLVGYWNVGKPFERDYSGETACNIDVWEVQPGRYPVRLTVDGYWAIVDFGEQPQVYSTRTNRVFSASSTKTEKWAVDERSTRCPGLQLYPYQLDKSTKFERI